MFRAAFLLYVPLLGSLAAVAATKSLDDEAKRCQFTLGHRRFDLCPVFEGNRRGWDIELEQSTPPTVTKAEYRISFSGPLRRNRRVPWQEQCPDGTWVCKIISNTRPDHEGEESRILQVIPVAGDISASLPNNGHDSSKGEGFAADEYRPGLNITAKLVPADENIQHDVLHIHLHGGYYVYRQQKADFQFICDHKAGEPTSPAISWDWNGTHTFEWRTKHACGQAMSAPDDDSLPSPPKQWPNPDTPPKDSEDDDVPGEKKMLDPDFLDGQSHRSILAVFASSLLVVLIVMYLVQRPPTKVRQFVTSYAKSHPRLLHSRVGERVLLRWAREDLPFDVGEEDIMINGLTGGQSAMIRDEGIPLKPSPRRSNLNNYGSA